MGFFSWQCKCCNRPAICDNAANEGNEWMTDILVYLKNGDRISGEYDGYGRVDGREIEYSADFSLYHRACWEAMGKPEYDGMSDDARCQGWFYPDGIHNVDKPEDKKDVEGIRLDSAYDPWEEEGEDDE